ncbi:hypothetical protein [Agromyces larvae]|uniref:Uncharacterized protein n=1 Tax=Agromyces larvae TaxID=2929802 RepID=A0ABY4BUK2_9MICO|nr:hypothetical protein [Agromyces larvae]UOE42891.1 hypothetical protein MTO99_11905 [Agromyces larvae]
MSDPNTPQYQPGDVVNGHRLTQQSDGSLAWVPVDTEAAAPSAPAAPTEPGAPAHVEGTPTPTTAQPKSRTWLWITLGAIGAVVLLIVLVVSIGIANLPRSAEAAKPDQSAGQRAHDEDEQPEASEPAEPAAPKVQDLSVAGTAFGVDTDLGWGWYAVTIDNPNVDYIFTSGFTVEAYDEAGVLLDSDTTYTTILSGQTVLTGNFMQLGNGSIARIEARGPAASGATYSAAASTGTFTVGNLAVSLEYEPYSKVTGQITSTFAEDQDFVQIDLVARDGAGTIVGVNSTYLDRLPAGGTAQFEQGFWKIPAGATVEAFPHL